MANTSLFEELSQWAYSDPLIYDGITAQQVGNLSDRETLLSLVKLMAERHQHTMRAYTKILEERPPSPFVVLNT